MSEKEGSKKRPRRTIETGDEEKKQPRGRPKKNYDWDPKKGEWIPNPEAIHARKEDAIDKPRGRPPAHCIWSNDLKLYVYKEDHPKAGQPRTAAATKKKAPASTASS